MLRRFLSLCLVVLGFLVAVPPTAAPGLHFAAHETKECTVYITKTGTKYHRGDCTYLRYSRRAVTRSQAIEWGYTACSRCGGSDCDR